MQQAVEIASYRSNYSSDLILTVSNIFETNRLGIFSLPLIRIQRLMLDQLGVDRLAIALLVFDDRSSC